VILIYSECGGKERTPYCLSGACEHTVIYWYVGCPVQVLRVSLEQQRSGTNVGESQVFPAHQREELVQQLETLSLKVTD
jgi:hypothetical protein